MGFKIEDGTGTGKVASVDDYNRLGVVSVSQSADQDMNQRSGKVWSIPFASLNPVGNDDYVVYIKNTGDKTIHISDYRISATAATQIGIHVVTGDVSGGTAISPISRTIGSASLPTATIESGTDLTGITSDGVLFYMECLTPNQLYHLSTSSKIRIPKGKAMAISVADGSANITGIVSLVEEG